MDPTLEEHRSQDEGNGGASLTLGESLLMETSVNNPLASSSRLTKRLKPNNNTNQESALNQMPPSAGSDHNSIEKLLAARKELNISA